MVNSLISVGLSSMAGSSRAPTAERLAKTAIARDADGSLGPSVWALSHALSSEGRSSEMVSKPSSGEEVCLGGMRVPTNTSSYVTGAVGSMFTGLSTPFCSLMPQPCYCG